MSESVFFDYLVWAWLATALLTFIMLFFVKAPYGRYTRKGWGPIIDRRLGWIIMETPSLLFFVLFFILGTRHSGAALMVFLSLWVVHYFHRSFIYPFQTRGALKTQTLAPVGLAVVFNLGNAYLNGRWLFSLGPAYPPEWLTDPRFIAGVAMFAIGFMICKQSDHILRNLRQPGESGYKIPKGGMFRFVSCPNYLGEIIEWSGWAMATWSLAGLSFAVWTFANLVPRAWSHHRWYKQKFPDYPPNRRAIFPYLL